MSSISLLLLKVHDNVHELTMKLNYSDPKFYTGGVNISKWSSLSKTEKKSALSKNWYLYYSYRNPETGKLERQSNIKAGINNFKDYRSRVKILKQLKQALIILLEKGYSPFSKHEIHLEDLSNSNLDIKQKFTKVKKVGSKAYKPNSNDKDNSIEPKNDIGFSFNDALVLVYTIKEKTLNSNSFPKFKSRISRFEKWCLDNSIDYDSDISHVTKKLIIRFLNEVLNRTSARNRNNTRTDLSSFFQVLVDNDIINENFIKKINVLKSTPIRNKTYTPKLQKDIFSYMKRNDPLLLLYVKFISYNFLRPIEVCRLKIEDLDVSERKIYVKAKNHPVKTKIIPEILFNELPDLTSFSNSSHLFSPEGIGHVWSIDETNKRDYFTKRFKKVKEHFGLGAEYGLYSFRHTFITKLYNEMIKNGTPFEVKSRLKLITGHSSMTALEKYLRDIDAELPEDYSNHF
jgi:integrase